METVALKPLFHRGMKCIGIYFARNRKLQSIIQNEAGAKWSRTNVCWYIKANRNNYDRLKKVLTNAAIVEYSGPDEYISRKEPSDDNEAMPVEEGGHHKSTATTNQQYDRLSDDNTANLKAYHTELILKGYSPNTIRTYINEFRRFLADIKTVNAADLKTDEIKEYLKDCQVIRKLSENTIHSRINAIRFYYEQVLGLPKFFFEISRPKRQLLLPKVLSKEQVAAVINSIENLKHRTVIMLTYACGLRVSEVVSLKVQNIDGQRRILYVERGKGKKDRVISLSPQMLIMLRAYYREYKPKVFLFEGQFGDEHLSVRSIQLVLQRAKAKAGIKQDGGMHLLRHSFATHLLDKGIDVVFIQKLLGHNDIKTTLKYLHVTNKDLVNILSPIEDIGDLLKK